MENKPSDRINRAWSSLPHHKQVGLTVATLILVALFAVEEFIMGGKSKLPAVLLGLISLAYVMFALLFFRQFPEIILAAGYVLGAVHIAVFLISILTRGRKDK